jgi:hypothetical protein
MAVLVIVVAAVIIAAVTSGGDGDSAKSQRSALTVSPTTASSPTTSATTGPPATTAPPATSVGALPGGIEQLTVAAPSHEDSYNRDLFGDGWIDADHDCQDTRAEVLIAESATPVTFTTAASCTVLNGTWVDPWSGITTYVARSLDIDHTVPLANAWRSGAWAWSPAERVAYANDLTDSGHLIGIPLGENRSKGDDGPEAWKPPNPSAWCQYARTWTTIKKRWNLTASPEEWSAIIQMAATC